MEVWKNKKCSAKNGGAYRRAFPQFFRLLPNFHKCLFFLVCIFFQAGRCRFNCINFSKISFYAFPVNIITSFIRRDMNNGTKGTSLDGEEGCLYRIHGVFLQPCQGLLDHTVIRSSPSSSRAVESEGVNPNRRIHDISFKNPEDVFAQDSSRVLWRVGLELDRNWCWACVVRGHVCRREVWRWVLEKAKVWLKLHFKIK